MRSWIRWSTLLSLCSIASSLALPLLANGETSLIDHSVVLFPETSSRPISVEGGADGTVFVTAERSNPTLVKLDRLGNVLWTFEGERREEIRETFISSIPLPDGGAIVCASRLENPSAPGYHLYPGAIYKIDASGHETGRFDRLQSSEGQTFSGGVLCASWGDDILFVATAFPFDSVPQYNIGGKQLVQNRVIRLSKDLVPIWTRDVPVYPHTNIIGARPAAQMLTDGRLLLGGAGVFSVIDRDGNVLEVKSFDFGMLVPDHSVPSAGYLLVADPLPNPWRLLILTQPVDQAKVVTLGSPANSYAMATAAMLKGGRLAIGAYKGKEPEILVFDMGGSHVKTAALPHKFSLTTSSDRLIEIRPTEGGVVALTQRFTREDSLSVVMWVGIR